MDYLQIVNLVFRILSGIMTLLMLPYIVFFILGVFGKKKFAPTEEKCRYGVVVSARNEAKVIGRLIDSIRNNDYPQDKIEIFVIAHNCTDDTAEVCRSKGAVVYEYNNPAERTKGYALRYLFKKIEEDYKTSSFDGFFVMDADNIMNADYISKMNDAFVAGGKKKIITSFRNSKNFTENNMSIMYGLNFVSLCRLEQRGRTVCGCSTRVAGTGFLLGSQSVANGWNYLTLCEDWEFTTDEIVGGNKVLYCDDAVFYDEQPTSFKIMFRQRLRWGKGHMDVFFTRIRKVIASIFRPKKYGGGKNGYSKLDIMVGILPLGAMTVSLFLLQVIAIAFTPLFNIDIAKAYVDFFIGTGYSLAGSYVAFALGTLFLFAIEHKRIGKVGFWKVIGAMLTWPLFMGMAIFFDCAALFVKKLEWKPIPHRYNKDEAEANKQKN